MELVYLWVDSYKNIEKQGFNFSPKFECSYDKKSNSLTIEPKKHIENFFSKNINITAIVGENGSGKSAICNSIVDSKSKIILIYKIEQEFYYYDSMAKNIDYPPNFKKFDSEKIEEIKLSYDFLSLDQQIDSNIFYNIYENNENIDLVEYKSLVGKVIYKHGQDIGTISGFKYNIIKIKSKLELELYIGIKDDNFRYLAKCSGIDKDEFEYYKVKHLSIRKKFLLYIVNLVNIDKVASTGAGLITELEKFETLNDMLNSHVYYSSFTTNTDITDLIDNYDDYCKFLEKHLDNEECEYKNIPLDNDLLFSRNFYSLLEINYYDKLKRKYEDLSHGEKHIYSSMLLLYDKIVDSDKDNILIVLDEIETSLHPKWQKALVSELFKLCEKTTGKKIQIVISSHSPFILSDLPKENVMFLKEGKQVDPDINTFGANIHTLLSHGFFMDGGLMGEFAKGKIEEIIEDLNKKSYKPKKKEKVRILQIIKSTGEPFLKNKLENMFYQKFDDIDFKEARKKELEAEEKRIKKELEKLD
ncbi:MAG: AAA family ATPase [Campylobacterota bacterium]|nr:AAA family ATPase [Campylobacterota bacterium]